MPVPAHLPAVKEGSALHYNPMNPSILKTDYGYKFICRTVNFTLMNGVYNTIDITDDTIRTRNFLIHYDKKFSILSQKEIVENLPRVKNPHILKLKDWKIAVCLNLTRVIGLLVLPLILTLLALAKSHSVNWKKKEGDRGQCRKVNPSIRARSAPL